MTKFWFPKYTIRAVDDGHFIECHINYGIFFRKEERVYLGDIRSSDYMVSIWRHANLHNINNINIEWKEE